VKVVEYTAVLGSSGRDKGFAAALAAVLGELGFTRDDAATGTPGLWPRDTSAATASGVLEVRHVTPERGAWACVGTAPPLARALATRVAARVQKPVQVFTATTRYDDRTLECTIEDRLIQPDGRSAEGSLARDIESSVGGRWKELCDGKSYALTSALLHAASEAWIAGPTEQRVEVWRTPPSLGDRRLDELASRVRVAVRAQLTAIDGRRCVRVTTADNATTTSFLTDDELAKIEAAVGGLLAR
jgi:hypothetical protein